MESSEAAPPCSLTSQIATLLETSPPGLDAPAVLTLTEACEITSTAVLMAPAGTEQTVWVELRGAEVLRASNFSGPLITLEPNFGLIIKNSVISGGAQRELPVDSALVIVNLGAQLVLDDGARLTGNGSRGVIANGKVTLRSPSASIDSNELTVRPGERVPGGAGVLVNPRGELIMEAGQISGNKVIASNLTSQLQLGTAPLAMGAGILALGSVQILGGEVAENGFDMPADRLSYGGGIVATYEINYKTCGNVVLGGAPPPEGLREAPPPVVRGNQADVGGGIVVFGEQANVCSVTVGDAAIDGNRAGRAGAAWVGDAGELALGSGATIGKTPNTGGPEGTSGVVNEAGSLKLAGNVVFLNGNGVSAFNEASAPVVMGHMAGATVPFEVIPYFSRFDPAASVVVARTDVSLGGFDAVDLAAFLQADPLRELVTDAAPGGIATKLMLRHRPFAVRYHGIEASENNAANPAFVTAVTNDVTLRDPVERPGFRFTGWASSNACAEKVTRISYGTSADVDLWACFAPLLAVRYASEAVAINIPHDSSTYIPGETAVVLPSGLASVPARSNYSFVGWETAEGAVLQPGATLTVGAADVELKAVWTPVQYSITYVGADRSTNPAFYTVESATITLVPPPTRIGYTFLGWFTDVTRGDRVTQILAGSSGAKTLYARYDPDVVFTPSPSLPPKTATATPTKKPSATPTKSKTPTKTPTVVWTPSPTPTRTPLPSWTPRPTPTYTPIATPLATPPPLPTFTPTFTPPVVPTEEPTPFETLLATPPEVTTAAPPPALAAPSKNPLPTPTDPEPPQASPPANSRIVVGWSLVASGTAGLAAMGTYWIRRLYLPRRIA